MPEISRKVGNRKTRHKVHVRVEVQGCCCRVYGTCATQDGKRRRIWAILRAKNRCSNAKYQRSRRKACRESTSSKPTIALSTGHFLFYWVNALQRSEGCAWI
eukprot:1716318-Amphidinium_carterae.1